MTVTSRVGPRMVIGESTHMLTPFIFNLYQPGYSFPILECSSGRAYLAFAEDKERAIIIEALQKDPELVGKDLLDAFCSGKLLDEIRRHGYAVKERNRYTENPGKTSSISVPIWGEGQLLGAAALTFFSSALRLKDAIAKFVPALIKTAEAIDISITAQSAPDLRRA